MACEKALLTRPVVFNGQKLKEEREGFDLFDLTIV